MPTLRLLRRGGLLSVVVRQRTADLDYAHSLVKGSIVNKVSTSHIVLALSCLLIAIVMWPAPAVRADDKPASQIELPLYPLKKGMKWESRGAITEVTDIVLLNKMACYKLEERPASKAVKEWIPNHEYLCVKDDGCVYLVGRTNGFGGLGNYDPPMCILKPASRKVQSWDFDCKASYPKPNEHLNTRHKGSAVQHYDTIKYDGKDVEAVKVTVDDDALGVVVSTWYLPGKGPVKEEYQSRPGGPQNPGGAREVITLVAGGESLTIGDVILNPTATEKEASTESIEAPPGVVTEFKKSRTITRELTYSTTIGVGAEIETKLSANLLAAKGELGTKVKSSIEAALGEKLSESETREQTVKIDGNVLPKAKIIWIDVYRTGTVEVTQEGKAYKIPFTFPIGTKLVVRKQ